MVLRGGRYGKFFACTKYPDCKGTKRLLIKVGVACPKCSGDLVERRTKRRRVFYGCAKYPECDFTSWSRPLPNQCPRCGGMTVSAGRDGKARCTECDWRGTIGEPELAAAPA
jgi:DNA topoisomerase-1